MKAFIKPIALTLLLALAPGCYRHGALLGAVVGTSIVTAAIVSSRPPPPPRVVYAPPPSPATSGNRVIGRASTTNGSGSRALDCALPGYGWEPSHWVEDPDGHWRLIRALGCHFSAVPANAAAPS